MASKALFLRVVRLMNFICVGLMLVDAVLRLINPTNSEPFFYILTFYLFGFAALLLIAELQIKRVLVYV